MQFFLSDINCEQVRHKGGRAPRHTSVLMPFKNSPPAVNAATSRHKTISKADWRDISCLSGTIKNGPWDK